MKPLVSILALLFLACAVSDADAGRRHRRAGKFKTSVNQMPQETGIFRPRRSPRPSAPKPEAPKTPAELPQFTFPDAPPKPEAPSDPVEEAGFFSDLDKEGWENLFEKILFIISLFGGISGGIAAESGGIGNLLKKL